MLQILKVCWQFRTSISINAFKIRFFKKDLAVLHQKAEFLNLVSQHQYDKEEKLYEELVVSKSN
jgi:hypothetical protein